jgi:hypothetical protein
MLERLGMLFGPCLQWLSFDERLLLDTNAKDLAPEELDYLEFEDVLSSRTYPEQLTDELAEIISSWFSGFSLGENRPDGTFGPGSVSFGPGGISERVGRPSFWEKALNCSWDPEVIQLFCELFDCDPDELIPGTPFFGSDIEERLYTNKIIFRPKNALKHRIISAEPIWLSWLQQAIKRPVYDYIDRHPAINIWFSNQEASRRLALRGSVDGSYATFDFSSASDAFSTTLVAKLWRRTYLCEALLAARSHTATLPDWGARVNLDKFAPMGSATCFFTMSVAFAACCELAIRRSCGHKARRDDYVVYGDDVIICAAAADEFRQIVTALGLVVNDDKSYWSTTSQRFYRESCGIEAYGGLDCTPIRYSRFQEPIFRNDVPTDGQWMPSIVSLLNRLMIRGLLHTRSAVIQVMYITFDRASGDAHAKASANRMRHVWYRLKRIELTDFLRGRYGPNAVIVPDGTATDFHCKSRFNRDLQVREVLVSDFLARPVDTYKCEPYVSNDTFRHLWYLRARSELTDGDPSQRILASAAGVDRQQWRDMWTRK